MDELIYALKQGQILNLSPSSCLMPENYLISSHSVFILQHRDLTVPDVKKINCDYENYEEKVLWSITHDKYNFQKHLPPSYLWQLAVAENTL